MSCIATTFAIKMKHNTKTWIGGGDTDLRTKKMFFSLTNAVATAKFCYQILRLSRINFTYRILRFFNFRILGNGMCVSFVIDKSLKR